MNKNIASKITMYLTSFSKINTTLLFVALAFFTVCSGNPEKIDIQRHSQEIPENQECLLGVDVGNTKTNFGIFSVDTKNNPVLLYTFPCITSEIDNFTLLIQQILEWAYDTHKITIKQACIGAPGFVSANKDHAKPHAMGCEIRAQELKQHTSLEQIAIINDLEIASYGIDALGSNDIIALNGDIKPRTHDTRGVIGFGTGLGSALMHWDEARGCYMPIPFEAGLFEFAPRTSNEQKLVSYLLNTKTRDYTKIIWDSLLSGYIGMVNIYEYLQTKHKHDGIPKNDTLKSEALSTKAIFEKREKDKLCAKAIARYRYLHTRYLVLFATITQCYGGLYITGGVVQNNLELFSELAYLAKVLTREDSYIEKMIQEIPIYLVKNKLVNLYGAARYMLLQNGINNSVTTHSQQTRTQDQYTAQLQFALQQGHSECVRLLIQHGARVSPDMLTQAEEWTKKNYLSKLQQDAYFDIYETIKGKLEGETISLVDRFTSLPLV